MFCVGVRVIAVTIERRGRRHRIWSRPDRLARRRGSPGRFRKQCRWML